MVSRLTSHFADKNRLPKWRYTLRQQLLPLIRWETPYLAWMQDRMRTPALDSYFAITANLGTHTFFMIGLPILFWCGYPSFGKGYVQYALKKTEGEEGSRITPIKELYADYPRTDWYISWLSVSSGLASSRISFRSHARCPRHYIVSQCLDPRPSSMGFHPHIAPMPCL